MEAMSEFDQVCPDCRYEGATTFLCAACDEANMDDDNHALQERRAMLAERAAVVKFLRALAVDEDLYLSATSASLVKLCADAIERGEHHK